jgi:hypothetical protein
LVYADSRLANSGAIVSDPIALKAAKNGRVARGTVHRDGANLAEVAVPITGSPYLVLLSGSLREAKQSVAAVRKQLLIAAIPSLSGRSPAHIAHPPPRAWRRQDCRGLAGAADRGRRRRRGRAARAQFRAHASAPGAVG